MAKKVSIEIELLDRISGSVDKINRRLAEMGRQGKSAQGSLNEIDGAAEKLKKTLAGLGVALSMKELVGKVASVRGEFQKLEVAFDTMLGSAEKADALMAQLVHTAAITPFDLTGVANGAKQLLAYGLEADKVNETLIRLGDIAAGLSIPLGDIVYLYGTTMAQGRLYTQDLNQFTGRGIPMIQELAKQFGVAESKVKELVEQGKVGFPEVQKVIESLTGEGSKFGGLMEEQSKTISGQIANIEDALDTMFNEMGQKSEGIINTTLSTVSTLVENYERFGRILLSVAATWGAYRAAVMLAAAASGFATTAEALHYNWLLLVEKAQKALNATMLANPYVLVATAIAGTVAALVSMSTSQERVNDILADYDQKKQQAIADEEKHRQRIEELCSVAGDESLSTDTRREALVKLEMQYPAIFKKYDTEYEKLKHIRDIKAEIAELDGRGSVTRTRNEQSSLTNTIKAIQKELQARQTGSNVQRNKKYQGISTQALYDSLRAYQGRLATVNKQAEQDRANTYFANLTGISNRDLQRQISERKNLLAKMQTGGKHYGLTQLGVGGTFNRDQLQGQLQLLQAEQNRRKEKPQSNASRASKAKADYEKALKEYNKFIGSTTTKLSDEEYEKQRKKLEGNLKTAKQAYDDSKAQTSADDKKADKAAAAAEKKSEQQRQAKEKLGQDLATLQQENDAKEVEMMQEGLQKKLRQIDNDYQQQKNKIAKQEADFKTQNKKAGVSTEADGLTKEQRTALDEALTNAEKQRGQSTAELYKAETQALQDYLKTYGTFQEQKLALAREYDKKIAEAERDGLNFEAIRLRAEKQQQVGSLNANRLEQQIDYSTVFSDLGIVLRESMETTLAAMREFVKTPEFRSKPVDEQKAFFDKMNDMQKNYGKSSFSLKDFEKLGQYIDEYSQHLAERGEAETALNDSAEKVVKAQDKYNKALKEGTEEEQKAAKQALDNATAEYSETSDAYQTANANVVNAQSKVVESADNLHASLDSINGLLQSMQSGSLTSVWNAFTNFDRKVNGGKLTDVVSKSLSKILGKAFEGKSDLVSLVIGAILTLLDTIKEQGIGGIVGGLIDAILGAVDGLIDNILSGKFIEQIIGAILRGVGKILNTIIGAIGSVVSGGLLSHDGPADWFTNSNADKVAETTEKLTKENERLRQSVDDLKDEMANQGGAKALTTYNEAVADQQRLEQNTMDILKAQMSYHGAHHSNAAKWTFLEDGTMAAFLQALDGTGVSKTAINALLAEYAEKNPEDKRATQTTVDSLEDIYKLTPEQMAYIRTYNVDLWNNMLGQGSYDKSEYWDAYADLAGQMEEITDAFAESLTQVSFDSLRSDFISSLMDMEQSAEDFSDNFTEMLMQSVLNAKIADLMDDELNAFYDEWADRAKDGLDTEDIDYLQGKWADLTEKGLQIRDEAAKVTGYTGSSSTSQTGKSGGFTAMTQDQGTKLEGMFTSGLQHWSSMDARLETVTDRMTTAETHLARIEENTALSASHLSELKEQVRQIIRDGLRMK